MKTADVIALLAFAAAAVLTVPTALGAGDRPGEAPAAASAPARAARLPAMSASGASAPQMAPQNPAARAAESARMPGELKPEQPVVPQISIALKNRRIDASAAASAASGPAIDETAARAAANRKRSP